MKLDAKENNDRIWRAESLNDDEDDFDNDDDWKDPDYKPSDHESSDNENDECIITDQGNFWNNQH